MLTFVSGSKHKIQEAQAILGMPISIAELDLPEIQAGSIEKIVEQKVQAAYLEIGTPVFVDDVGFYVEAWNGFPGPYIKFLLAAGGAELLIKMMAGEDNRKAVALACIGYYDGHQVQVFMGPVAGTIGYEVCGESGFGFDKVFIPDGHNLTYSQMSPEEKNIISHRYKALTTFREFLSGLPPMKG